MSKSVSLDRDEVVRLYQSPMSTLDVARLLGVNPETIRLRLKAWGIPRHPAKNLPRPQPNKARKMEANGFWRGGRVTDRLGYVLLKMNGHPDANCLGYVREHRLVMAKKLGRELLPGEVVHHANGDVKDNRPENLALFASNADHLGKTLRGKCPNWTPAGRERMLQNGQRAGERLVAIRRGLEAYARMHSGTPRRFLASLSKDERRLCRMAVELGRFEPLADLERGRETIQSAWLALQSPRSRRLWGRRLASPR